VHRRKVIQDASLSLLLPLELLSILYFFTANINIKAKLIKQDLFKGDHFIIFCDTEHRSMVSKFTDVVSLSLTTTVVVHKLVILTRRANETWYW